jgi:hypothetical protein
LTTEGQDDILTPVIKEMVPFTLTNKGVYLMKKSANSTNVTSIARPGSKRDDALRIFQSVAPGKSHRQDTIAQLQSQLGQKPVTAATYYDFCVKALEQAQVENTQRAISSSAARKYTAVKFERGSDSVVNRAATFLKRADAEQFNSSLGYNKVVPGVVLAGQAL